MSSRGLSSSVNRFQPTRPLRGATDLLRVDHALQGFQPTRPLRGATHSGRGHGRTPQDFNPRAPCGARPQVAINRVFNFTFQPTRPLRGATADDVDELILLGISTHAPLAGRDGPGQSGADAILKFQPTRPLRGATADSVDHAAYTLFQPTRPLRGATPSA